MAFRPPLLDPLSFTQVPPWAHTLPEVLLVAFLVTFLG